VTKDLMNETKFLALLHAAQPGEWITYYEGDLRHDVFKGSDELKTLGSCVFEAHERGECILVQRRLGAHHFRYIAIKRQPQQPKKTATKPRSKIAGRDRVWLEPA
jgi:hypothetical protein